jgi:hypothetical protein
LIIHFNVGIVVQYEASYFTQFVCLYRRTVRNIWREPTLFRARVFQSAVLGLIVQFSNSNTITKQNERKRKQFTNLNEWLNTLQNQMILNEDIFFEMYRPDCCGCKWIVTKWEFAIVQLHSSLC